MHRGRIEVPEYIACLLRRLDAQGYTGYLVGGCVRDALLGRCPQDYDIAVGAPPRELLRIFSGYHTVETGARYGTVTVMADGHPVEITSFRRDGTYTDGRHPRTVEYTDSLAEDLARRDFTINAMAYRPDAGLVDPFGGEADLRRGVLTCVGDPRTRFAEDGLRILRAMRFCAVLGFSADAALVSAANACSPLLGEISAERVFSELTKCICGSYVRQVLEVFATPLCTVIPELAPAVGFDQKNPHHIYTVYGHIAAAVAACPPVRVLRLTMLLHDIAKPYVMTEDEVGVRHFRGHQERGAQMAGEILARLTCDRKTAAQVCRLIRYHDLRPAVDRCSIHRYVLKVGGYETALLLTAVRRADLSAQAPAYHNQFSSIDAAESMILQLQREGAPADVRGLAVRGADLLAAGIPSGPQMGQTLAALLEAVADGKVENTREALLLRAGSLILEK